MDTKVLNQIQQRFNINISELPDELDLTSYCKYYAKFYSIKIK